MPLNHPILTQSFALIDQEIGEHSLNDAEYQIVRRIIHATADFEYKNLTYFSPHAIQAGIYAIQQQKPIIVDVSMIRQGIKTMVSKTFQNPIITAVEQVSDPLPGKTRTETGLIHCFAKYPQGIYIIGNAPTALLSLCDLIPQSDQKPALVIGTPVGFINVLESKEKLAKMKIPQIRTEGRKGGSPVASAIVNALCSLSFNN